MARGHRRASFRRYREWLDQQAAAEAAERQLFEDVTGVPVVQHPGFVAIDNEVLTAMITALEPEKTDIAAWERELTQ